VSWVRNMPSCQGVVHFRVRRQDGKVSLEMRCKNAGQRALARLK
jgi:hypothetical protein